MASGVFWIGQNGKTYMKADNLDGVQEWKAPLQTPQMMGLSEIRDPALGDEVGSAPSGGGTAPKVLNQGAVDATQQAIDSLGTERSVGMQNIEDNFGSIIGKYDKEAAKNEADYVEQGETNTNNLQKNKQNALIAGSQGLRGLRGVLGSYGALSGDGTKLANRAVTEGVNEDIGEAADTFAGNAQTLDKSIGNFRDEDKTRREEAQTQRTNQKTNLEGTLAAKEQNYYQKMAEIYGGADRTAEANDFLARAGALNNTIASKTAVAATPFSEKAAAFTPGSLESYLAGAGDMTVEVSGAEGDAGGQSILANRRKKEEQEKQAALAVA